MKAAVLYESGTPLRIEEIEIDDPKPGEVLVRMAGSGICRTDLSMCKGYFGKISDPIVPGHEGAGTVEKVTEGISGLRKGDQVLLTWMPSCGKCFYCTNGTPNLCENGLRSGGAMLDGTKRLHKGNQRISHHGYLSTYAEYCVVPEQSVVKVPSSVRLDKACIMGCSVLTGVGAVLNTAKVREGSSVAIIGLGGVGMNVVQGSVIANADIIVGIDSNEQKLTEGKVFGTTHSIDSKKENVVDRIAELTDRRGVDYAFEVVGKPETSQLAVKITRRGGTTIIVGVGKVQDMLSINMLDLQDNGKTLKGCLLGSVNPRSDMLKYLRFYMNGKLNLDRLVSKTFRLEQVNQAFDDLEAGRMTKGVIVF